jgi:hypothetical protein
VAEDTGNTDRERKQKPVFSVAQARRDLREAERNLKDLESQKVTGPLLDQAKDAVKTARRAVENMTSGSRGDKREARQEFMQDYYNELGGPWIAELVKRDEELRRLFEKAVRSDDLDGFMDDIYQSKWWNDPEKSGSWKQAFRLEFSKDKTAWNDSLDEAKQVIKDQAKAMYDLVVPEAILDQIARRFLYEGWSKNENRGLRVWLASQLDEQQAAEDSTFKPGGMLVDAERTLRDAARGYGVYRPENWFTDTAEKILNPDSNFTDDDAWNELISEAESLYPVFQGKLSKDRSVRDVAAGYIGSLARYLEINDPEMIELDDPLLQRAFTNIDQSNNPSLMPLWQFNQEIKKDARWQYTSNALNTYSQIGSDLARMMGFVG